MHFLGLHNLAALLVPIAPRETVEKAMILTTRKYAYHQRMNKINKNDDDDSDVSDNEEAEEEERKYNEKEKKIGNEDEVHIENDIEDRKRKTEGDCVKMENITERNKSEGETRHLVCSYYHTISPYSDVACKIGVRRACVLLGTNGTYNTIKRNFMINVFHFIILFALLYFANI